LGGFAGGIFAFLGRRCEAVSEVWCEWFHSEFLVFSIWFVVLIFSQDPGKDPAQTRRVIGESGKEGKFFLK
jgi:hypothetical protein